jgi:hypothetical protein
MCASSKFEGDRHCRAERFTAYRQALGERFVARVLSPFFEQGVGSPHSVVAAHLVDAAGQPTLEARDEILCFLAQRLGA